jgi:hypothetical protein
MTDVSWQERRRYARRAPAQDARLSLPVVHDIQVADISESGMLFWCGSALRVGQRVRFRVLLDREPFTASAEVVRTDAERDPTRSRHCIGARFVALDENSARTLKRFLQPAR